LKPGQVHDVMHRAVKRGLARREAVSVPYLSLDEKSFLSHKRFVSVLTDLEGMRVLDICRDRTMDDASALIRSALTQEQLARVKCVTMDMWDGYVAAVRMTIPQADIVFDRFHVSRYLVEAVNQTRIEESKRLVKQGDMSLKGSKFFWSYSAEKVSSKLKAKYGHLLQVNLATAKAWALKETFRSFFAQQGTQEGRQFFLEWRQSVSESGNRFMSKVSKMLERYYHGLENYLIHHKTNSAAEGVNSLIHEIKFAARGFRTFEGFRTAILFFLGGLNLYPQKTS
jgi:transposase